MLQIKIIDDEKVEEINWYAIILGLSYCGTKKTLRKFIQNIILYKIL